MSVWVEKWAVPSSDGKRTYNVSRDEDGNFGCSCPAWTRRRKMDGSCKHIKAVQIMLGSQQFVKVLGDPDVKNSPEPKTRKIKIIGKKGQA